ncbi:hypothetical protein HPB51_025580 [Rhipicephalus microplus]|uniref:C2HC/C3H-type domain-containing protein n=1 Tax=Rhipicephalus microplus TaxID=6941 RepID=A0A9J6E5J9_RHIMP|nr:hypothetical protein HPB51_025580 [Rhipicephalus microplus]
MSASRLEQMRSQFQQNLQQRSGLPRPTRIPGPTTAAASKVSPPVKQATPSQSCTNGHSDCRWRNNLSESMARFKTAMLTKTSRPSEMGSQKPAAKPASLAASRTASSVARSPQTVPSSKAPSVKPAAARAVSVEQPKKFLGQETHEARKFTCWVIVCPPLRQRQDRREATNGTPPVSTQQRTPAAAPKAAPPPPEARPLGPNQERCDICGRGFNKDRIEKHRTICQKAATKKVKVFDATKMRTKGTEAEAFVKKGLHKKEVKVKKPNWRAKHEEFLNAVRQARMVQEHLAAGGKLSDLPPPPPSENPDYVQCPKCLRKFNETAAERHIPRCNLAPKTSSSTPTRRPAAVYGRKVTRLFDQSTSCFTRVDQSSRVTTDHLGKC